MPPRKAPVLADAAEFCYHAAMAKTIKFRPRGICAQEITVVLNDDDTVSDVSFYGGCDGNHRGLNALCKGMKADEVIARLEGIRCGYKNTSCPDQLAQALKTR